MHSHDYAMIMYLLIVDNHECMLLLTQGPLLLLLASHESAVEKLGTVKSQNPDR